MSNFFKYNPTHKYCLISKINGLADDSRRTRFHLLKRAKAKRSTWILDARRRAVSQDTRHHLLAYAFMRGVSYVHLEHKCHENNKPSAGKILDIVRMHGSAQWKLEDIEQWLSTLEGQ